LRSLRRELVPCVNGRANSVHDSEASERERERDHQQMPVVEAKETYYRGPRLETARRWCVADPVSRFGGRVLSPSADCVAGVARQAPRRLPGRLPGSRAHADPPPRAELRQGQQQTRPTIEAKETYFISSVGISISSRWTMNRPLPMSMESTTRNLVPGKMSTSASAASP